MLAFPLSHQYDSHRPTGNRPTDCLGPGKPEGKEAVSVSVGPKSSLGTCTYPEDGNDKHVQLSLETLVHLFANLFDFIFDRKSIVVDIGLGVDGSIDGLIVLVLLTPSVLEFVFHLSFVAHHLGVGKLVRLRSHCASK